MKLLKCLLLATKVFRSFKIDCLCYTNPCATDSNLLTILSTDIFGFNSATLFTSAILARHSFNSSNLFFENKNLGDSGRVNANITTSITVVTAKTYR
jgi:hypothetical protein